MAFELHQLSMQQCAIYGTRAAASVAVSPEADLKTEIAKALCLLMRAEYQTAAIMIIEKSGLNK